MPMQRIHVTEEGNGATLIVANMHMELVRNDCAHSWARQILALMARKPKKLILDFSGVRMIADYYLNQALVIRHNTIECNIELVLCMDSDIRTRFRQHGSEGLYRIESNLSDAQKEKKKE